jgi:hypothetical protein
MSINITNANEYAFCLLAVSHNVAYAIEQYVESPLMLGWPRGVGSDTPIIEIDRMMHEAHVADPGIRARAIEILAEGDGDKMFILKSENLPPEQAKDIAQGVADVLDVKFGADAVISPGCTWYCDHTHDQPTEWPQICVMELNNDVENQLISMGWTKIF